METVARDRFKATRPALIETRQEVLARPWGNWDARAPPLELSRGVSPRDPASNPTPRCVPPKTRNEGSDKNFSTKRSWQRGSQKPDRPPADKQRDVSRPDEETAAHGRRASSGGDHGVLGAGSGDCGHSLVAALKTPEPHAFKDWLGGVGAGTAVSGRGPSDRHAARGNTRGITIDT